MSRLQRLLDEYAQSHRHPVNERVHWVCVPLIMLSLIGLLWAVPIPLAGPAVAGPAWNAGALLVVLSLAYYAALSIAVFLGMVLVGAALLGINLALAGLGGGVHLAVSAGVFAAAWVSQVWGHRIEGRRPSFLKDLQFLLVGPAWLLMQLYRAIGLCPESPSTDPAPKA